MLTFGSLFAGIGGFDLGLERSGMVCRFQVEIDPFCLQVLAKHWPDVERFGDVRECGSHNLPAVDLICGGFPCQDVSLASATATGVQGIRSGLWLEFYRLICDLRPRYVIVENVAALLARGMDVVLGNLAASGYDAEWDCIPAAAVGAPHLRDRTFIVAYPNSISSKRLPIFAQQWGRYSRLDFDQGRWCGSPSVCRVDDGLPPWMDRRRSLGNAVVPAVAQWIGERILEVEANHV